MTPIETFEQSSLTVHLYQDTDASNPREEFDHAGKMICWHRRYNLGDKHGFAAPSDFESWAKRNTGAVVLSLYLMDHSGISISCRPFGCPWDSGQVGYIYCDRATIKKEWGGDKEACHKYLEGEVEEYNDYLTGQVFGYVVEPDLDSCWGFYGFDYAKTEAISAAKHCATAQAKLATETAIAECVQ